MPGRTRNNPEPLRKSGKPGTTPDGRERQLINMAFDRAEQQILDGSVSAQVLTHYLKLGSSRERLEQERLSRENELLVAKAEAMQSHKRIEELYIEAMNAMRSYSGQDSIIPPDDVFDDDVY